MDFQSVNKMLENSFKTNWDLPALSNYKGVTLFYRDVARRIAKLHIAFEQCGLKRGDKVAICGKNQANWGVAFLAALTYGAVPVPLLHEFKPGNIHFLVNHSEAKVLFADETIWENLSIEEMPGLEVVVQINNFKFYYARTEELQQIREHLNESFGKKYPNNFEQKDLDYYEDKPDELAMINYTSGTSGFSKGVMIPYRALWSNVYFAHHTAEPQIKTGDDVVSILPTAHMYGMMFEFFFEMTMGCHVHFLTRLPSPKIILEAFKDIKPCIMISVPLVIEKVYRNILKPVLDRNKIFFKVPILNKAIDKKICGQLRAAFGGNFEEIILGGAAFNPEVEAFFHRIGFQYTVGYGMTECAPLIAYEHWNKNPLGSCGKAVDNMEIKIDSENPEMIPGEVLVKGANVFLGYFKNSEATRDAFTSDGWFRTGDMGVLDSEGYLYLRGRCKCMILGPSGQNIYPEEIEAVVDNVTYVVDSLVVEEKDGSLTCLVYPDYNQASMDGMSPQQLQERLTAALPEINRQIPNYASIRRMEYLREDFERTPKKSIKRYLYQRK